MRPAAEAGDRHSIGYNPALFGSRAWHDVELVE
jgi:hypothetical protein